ncbi:MAG: glycosyltransferase family 39 protein, partial [Candidatus Diapherotrites archaeon]|nr:glycosyltransferase family 39 protein [Candidatus Diapherotrites archaeon]
MLFPMLPELDSRKMALLLAFAIALVALFAYGDFFGIELMEFDAIPKLVSHSQASADEFFSILTGPEQNYLPISSNYRPFGSLILWLMFMFTGLNFTAFHALNFALHAINSVLVFFLAKRLIKGNMFPFLAALVFALHPIHLNTVLFVSRMHELLACFALLSSLLLLMKFLEKRKQHYFLASILFCAIGIFSKEAGSLIPFVLFACCLIFLKEKNIRSLTLKSLRICFPFFALVAAYFALMLFSLGSLAGYAYSLDYTKSQVVFSFLQFLFCPINFLSASIPSQFNAFLSNPLANTLFLLFFIGLSIFSLKFFSGKEQDRQVLFLLCWFLTFIFAFTALNALAVWYSY